MYISRIPLVLDCPFNLLESVRTEIVTNSLHALAVSRSRSPDEDGVLTILIRLRLIEYDEAAHSVRHYNKQVERHSIFSAKDSFGHRT